ncbi:hypothetical protein SAMD00019534_114200 [Acytostelium subglobosum LB1]|uniref:hypothetical protein n=1 Tax=Acytostelium subglobosum LB1 TaxID=1410327 RepID=UPI0006449A73|nr:hypothetical protein SAMD00019534_114200 [Acytostelium subglobosum LB1]GAM28244.1 hypothetical protein SAMD00019534_114200 [Acytostelium subglobosum LB1]|eukprot:XP_012748878.1 hypothetical protein SAMD00019534_114200 [Acytostelium subglobosum LB1]
MFNDVPQLRSVIIDMLEAITFVTTCTHHDRFRIINVVQLATLPGLKITPYDITSSLLAIATTNYEWAMRRLSFLFTPAFINAIIEAYGSDKPKVESLIDQYSNLLITLFVDDKNNYKRYQSDLINAYHSVSSTFGHSRLEERIDRWFITTQCISPSRDSAARLFYLAVIHDKTQSKLLINHKHLIQSFIIATLGDKIYAQLHRLDGVDVVRSLRDVLDIVMEVNNDDIQQQVSTLLENGNCLSLILTFQVFLTHLRSIEPYFATYIRRSLPKEDTNTMIKRMGSSFIKIFEDDYETRSWILTRFRNHSDIQTLFMLDGITSCYKTSGQEISQSLIKYLNIIYNFDNATVYYHYISIQSYNDMIARGMIRVFEATGNIKNLHLGMSYLISHKGDNQQQHDDCDIDIDSIIDKHQSVIQTELNYFLRCHNELVANFDLITKFQQRSMIDSVHVVDILGIMARSSLSSNSNVVVSVSAFINSFQNPSDIWIQYIDVAMDCHKNCRVGKSRKSSITMIMAANTLRDQLSHAGTVPVFHLLKYLYCMQTLGFNFKRTKHILLDTLDHHDEVFIEQRRLFKEFKRSQVLLIDYNKAHPCRGASISMSTLPLIIINKIVQECIIGYIDDKLDQAWLVSLSTVNTQFHRVCSMTITHHSLPIKLCAPLSYFGSKFCLFTDTPPRMNAMELVYIPTQHLPRCLDRLVHLSVPFTTNHWNSDYEHEHRPSFIMVNAPNLQRISFVECVFTQRYNLKLIKLLLKDSTDRKQYYKLRQYTFKTLLKSMYNKYVCDDRPHLKLIDYHTNITLDPCPATIHEEHDSPIFPKEMYFLELPLFLTSDLLPLPPFECTLIDNLLIKIPNKKLSQDIPESKDRLGLMYQHNQSKLFKLTLDIPDLYRVVDILPHCPTTITSLSIKLNDLRSVIKSQINGSLAQDLSQLITHLNQRSLFGTLTSLSMVVHDPIYIGNRTISLSHVLPSISMQK